MNSATLEYEVIPKTVLRFLFYVARKFKYNLVFLILTSILYATCQTVLPYFIKLIINVIYQAGDNKNFVISKIQTPIFILCSLWILTQVVSNIQGFYILKVMPYIKSTIKQFLFSLLSDYQYDFFTTFSAEHLNKKINDIAYSVEKIMQFFVLNILSMLVSLLITVVILLFVSPVFSVIIAGWLILHCLNGFYFIKRGVKLEEKYVKSLQKTSNFMGDILSNVMNVRLFNMKKNEERTLFSLHDQEVKNYCGTIIHFEKMRLFQSLFSILLIIFNALTLLYLLHKGLILIGDFIMVLILSITIINFVWYGSIQLSSLIRELGVLKSNINLINYTHVRSSKKKKDLNYNISGSLTIKNVTFQYKNGTPILDKLSLSINAGDKIGIIGQSGFGKTTLLKLLLGLYTHNSGSIYFDKYNIKNLKEEIIYQNVSVITQEAKLLNRTIIENIKYGRQAATDSEVVKASKIAGCHEFVEKLPQGYHTVVGENGIKLSGGERQRIALARMVIRNTPIVIMDEPSSSLDSETEDLIFQNLYDYLSDKTVIIVSHKSNLLKLVQKVYVFENGKLTLIPGVDNPPIIGNNLELTQKAL